MTSKKALIALSSAIALGVLASGSAALAFNENDGGNETGGYVLPGSMDGVNPVYHPRWFPQYGRVMRAYDRANAAIYSGVGGHYPSAGSAYASARALASHIHHSQR